MENYLMINGKKIELTEEQIKILTDEEENKDIWNPKYEENYYWIDYNGKLFNVTNQNDSMDNAAKKVANCCTDESIMEKRALQETLNRLLWRFSLQNGWNDKLYKDRMIEKYHIVYDYPFEEFGVHTDFSNIHNNVSFKSSKVAYRAIDEIIKPFIEQHPELMENNTDKC